MLYEDLTPEVSTIHAILRVNGEVMNRFDTSSYLNVSNTMAT